ncbi:hypothetical protein PHYSODRAFT_284384 [Phytophthora sojae]|uniref:Uncharacterized protein n=1 Tax=Phytophthora sojae (strain P6497) TaxID=1094619 RepID=G4YGG6_PHYSP|nr:hypothetical protein PHYSODRAFT_284384 [Phytophthora sojae]EGZ29079.1 hypothetical protein PHYSODRAFT_284384 [Phytophthora sojae]|eukprot:XP_009516354.1 hypothetical protein PHYSODRAFT_284384 [Phytophthora sojae]
MTGVCAVEPTKSSRPDISPLVQGAALSADVSSTHKLLSGAVNSEAGALTRHDVSTTSNNEERGVMFSLTRPFKDAKFYTTNYVADYVWNIRFTA